MNCRIDGCIHRGTFGVGTRSCRKGSSSFGTKMSRPKRYGQCFSIVPIALALLYRTCSAFLQVMECINSLYERALEHTSRPFLPQASMDLLESVYSQRRVRARRMFIVFFVQENCVKQAIQTHDRTYSSFLSVLNFVAYIFSRPRAPLLFTTLR